MVLVIAPCVFVVALSAAPTGIGVETFIAWSLEDAPRIVHDQIFGKRVERNVRLKKRSEGVGWSQ